VELGMAVVFKVGQHEDFAPSPPGFPRCNNYMPSEQELTNSDMDNDVLHPIISTPNWWPLKSTFTSGSSKIFLSPCLALLLLLCAAVR
jgi:hypothetical protein